LRVFSVKAYHAGKRKQKKIVKHIQRSKSNLSGGSIFFLILVLVSALFAWFAWDFGWFSSNEEIDDQEDFFNDQEDSWK